MADLIPVEVVATLAHGISHATPWATSLDGLLAAQLWAGMKAAAARRGEHLEVDPHNPTDLELPLERCTLGGSDWHWAATFGHLELVEADPEVRTWVGKADHRSLETLGRDPLPAVISDRQGRFRSRRMPLLASVARTITWRAVGDPTAIGEIVRGVAAIGKKRGVGEGRVLSWTVTPIDCDRWSAGHLHPDGRLGRLAPMACLLDHYDDEPGPVAMMGLRPPYMHPARRSPVVLPAN